jgi:FAD/FMN-containing dehydrogenase
MSAGFYETAKSLLAKDEIITPGSPLYETESSVMAVQKQRSPKFIIRPTSVESLQRVLPHLASADLDFAVRSQGYGSSSAKDVVLSMSAFEEFEFDGENEIVTLGAGQPWSSYYENMERVAPNYTGLIQFWSSLSVKH